MNEAEAKETLKKLLASGFGISGHRVSNGADFYHCSACCVSKETKGHADVVGELTDVDHAENCGLVKLATWANS